MTYTNCKRAAFFCMCSKKVSLILFRVLFLSEKWGNNQLIYYFLLLELPRVSYCTV
jgi:hypothetical protein